jgi:hypothetical protein
MTQPRPDLGIEIRMFVFRDRDGRPKVTIGGRPMRSALTST